MPIEFECIDHGAVQSYGKPGMIVKKKLKISKKMINEFFFMILIGIFIYLVMYSIGWHYTMLHTVMFKSHTYVTNNIKEV